MTNGNEEIIIGTKFGYSVRFKEDTIRSMSRMAAGVKGVTLRDGDQVVGAAAITDDPVSYTHLGSRTFEATLENLQFVKLFQNAQEVIDKLNDKSQDIKRVAVVGAGYIGVELAEAFQRHGKEVILIDVVDTCLAGYYDHDLTDLMACLLYTSTLLNLIKSMF